MGRLSRHPVRLQYLLYYLFLSPCRQNHGKPWCETKAKGTCNQTASQRKTGGWRTYRNGLTCLKGSHHKQATLFDGTTDMTP